MSKENNNENMHNDVRAEKMKLFSIGSVVLLAAIILLVNILFDKILGKAMTFDFSDTAQNSVSQLTADYLDSLSADTHIRIVGLFNRPENVANTKYQYIIPLLDDYVKTSKGKVTVEYIDPLEHPSIINQLDPTNSQDLAKQAENFVIEYNGNLKVIAPIDCYSYDENYFRTTNSYLITGNNAEYTFTNAMNVLTNGYAAKAYIVTGLKEEGNENITKILNSMTIDVDTLAVSENFTVPDDCSLLILNGPNSDISEKMYVAMSDYISRGGKLLVAVDYSTYNANESYVRLNLLLSQMNINIQHLLIYENDPTYQLGGYPIDSNVLAIEPFADYSSSPVLHNSYARSIAYAENPNTGFTALPVLLTSDNAATIEVDESGRAVDNGMITTAQYYAAMYSSTSNADGAKAFVFGTLNFTSDQYINSYGLNDYNVEFLRSCIRELVSAQTLDGINIPTKLVDSYTLANSKSTTSLSTLMLVIFMVFIPVILISVAVIVYSKRKNL